MVRADIITQWCFLKFLEIKILGYWDINSTRRALNGRITVFRNRDIGISDPLYPNNYIKGGTSIFL